MHWKQYDPNNVPQGEVLAQNHSDVMVGYLDNTNTCYSGWRGNDECITLSNVTHYILVEDLVKLHNELEAMKKKECPGLNVVEADVKVEYDQETKIMTISLVWNKPISMITVPIEFIPYDPTTDPGKTDDPV